MPQPNMQTPEERRFLVEQARQLQQSGQICKLVTNSEHSIITGRVAEATDGGVVFESAGSGERLISPWSNVAEFVVLQGTGQQAQSASAGGYGYNQRQ